MARSLRARCHSTLPLVAVCMLVSHTMLAGAADFYLEATLADGHPSVTKRDDALTGTTVRLKTNDTLRIRFCLRQPTSVRVLSVLYSNDGDSDTVGLVLDQTFLGTFTSPRQTDWGRLWNVFLRTPPFFPILDLAPGRHSLSLLVLQPADGLEVSAVHLQVNDERLTKDVLTCVLFCHAMLPTAPTAPTPGMLAQGYMKQASYATKCAEEDNVKVPLYAPGVSEYTITATLPTYSTSANRREPNTTSCPFLTPLLWTFQNVPLNPRIPVSQESTMSRLLVSRTSRDGPTSTRTTTIVRVEFTLRGQLDGFVDAAMGSTLTVTFPKMAGKVVVRPEYSGRSQKTTALPELLFFPEEPVKTVGFPDFTWRDGGANVILLEIDVITAANMSFLGLQLERRPMTGEKVQTVHKTDKMIMDALDVDFWWREPESMRLVNGETGQVWEGADFFRVSLPVPWNGGFAQVFVMYQDGNIRLLPLPPPGFDWIPFGSSVLLGYSEPAHLRPSAPVSTVTFHPSSLNFNITYRDGTSALAQLSVGIAHTELKVYEVKDSRTAVDPSLTWPLRPFATLRSMYLEDGNSDCDSVLVDGRKYFPVLDPGWTEVAGTSFFFFRRCESKHLTLSPDIRIDVKRTDAQMFTAFGK